MWAVLANAAEGAAAGAKEVVNPVIPDVNEMIWGAIAFFLLYILFQFVCLPPLRAAMRQREEQIRGDLEASERVAADAEQVRRDYDATVSQARAEAARVVDEARVTAEAQRTEALRAAETEAAATKAQALAELEQQRADALAGLHGAVTSIAVGAASKVLGSDLDVAANTSVVSTVLSGN